MLNLTDVERRILINQSRILAALYPLESTEFERTIEILSEGYHESWHEVVMRGLKQPFLKEEMNFVYQVLEMYDWLQKSYYALTLEDKLQLREQMLVFPGFEAKTERRHLAYATFLLGNLERFAFVEVTKPLSAPKPMSGTYEEMLKGLPTVTGDILPPAQLKAVMAYLSALKSAPANAPAAPRKVARR